MVPQVQKRMETYCVAVPMTAASHRELPGPGADLPDGAKQLHGLRSRLDRADAAMHRLGAVLRNPPGHALRDALRAGQADADALRRQGTLGRSARFELRLLQSLPGLPDGARCWVPNWVNEPVEVTVNKLETVQVPCTYQVQVCKPQTQTHTVNVCHYESQMRTCSHQVCEYHCEMRTRTFTVTECKFEERTREVSYVVCVPRTETHNQQVVECEMRTRWSGRCLTPCWCRTQWRRRCRSRFAGWWRRPSRCPSASPVALPAAGGRRHLRLRHLNEPARLGAELAGLVALGPRHSLQVIAVVIPD